MIRQCIICGKEFESLHNAKTCSIQCRVIRLRGRERKSKKKKLVANDTPALNVKRLRGLKMKRNDATDNLGNDVKPFVPIPTRECVICGKKFTPKTNDITCSLACRKERDKMRGRKWRAMKYKTDAEFREKFKARNYAYMREHAEYYKEHTHKQNIKREIRRKLARAELPGVKQQNFCCICGKNFTPHFPTERFCSNECRLQSPLWSNIFMPQIVDAGFSDIELLD